MTDERLGPESGEHAAAWRRGAHVCALYDDAAEAAALATGFAREAAARGERCACVGGGALAAIASALADEGLAEPHRRAPRLIRAADRAPAALADELRALAEEAERDGAGPLRLIVDATPVGEPADVRATEALLAGALAAGAIALCLYPRGADGALLRAALATHPLVLVDGAPCDNLYHLPPDEPGVDRMLARLRRARHADQALRDRRRAVEDEHARLRESARAARREADLFYDLTRRLVAAATVEEACEAALDAVARALAVERLSVLLLDADGVMRFKRWRGLSEEYRRAVEGHSPWRRDDPRPRPVLIADAATDPSVELYRSRFAAEGIAALAFVPIVAAGRLLGKFMLYYRAPHAFSTAEVELATALASQVGVAVLRKRAEEDVARRGGQLTLAVEACALALRARDPGDLLQRCAEMIVACLEVEGARIWLADEAGRALTLRASAGGCDFDAAWIAAEERPVLVNDLSADPRYGMTWTRRAGVTALAGLPLAGDGRVLGVVAVVAERPLAPDTLDVLAAVADTLSLGLERTRAGRTLELLAEAGAALASSLDYQRTLGTVANLLVPALADGALVDLVDDAGRAHRVLAVNPLAGSDAAPALALAIGETQLVSDMGGDGGMRSLVVTPLVARDRTIGAIAFFTTAASGRSYRHDDVVLLEEIARRAAVAIDNARLHERLRESEERARQADTRKDEFLAMLGHELRNPLAPIVTALHLLKLRGDAGGEHEREVLDRQVRHLVRLVDDLMDISRITRGKIQLQRERVELASVVAKAIEMASPLLESRAHVLSVEVPRDGMPVDGDPMRLAQVLANLLTNAAKYTDQRGAVAVAARRDGNHVVVTVRDTGMGISADVLPTIFEPFVQGTRALDRAGGGLGLGLTLVRSLVEMHGGAVAARSEGPGRGSEFEVRLPLQPAPTPTARAAVERAAPAPATPARRVLVVDDNIDAADTLAEALRLAGHEVAVAHDGPEALQVASEFHPETAVLDIGLPVMDGYELARRLRDLAAVRLIAVSGYGQETDRAKSRAAGFAEHFVKPVDMAALAASVARP